MAKKRMSKVSLEEQETTINVDYFTQTLDIFTSCKNVYNNLYSEIGEPIKFSRAKGKVIGGKWKVQCADRKKIKKILSITNIIPFQK